MNDERVYFDGEEWKATYNGVGQVHCDGGVVALINQLRTVYGLEVDKEHPLYFNPKKSEKWVVVCLPDNGR